MRYNYNKQMKALNVQSEKSGWKVDVASAVIHRVCCENPLFAVLKTSRMSVSQKQGGFSVRLESAWKREEHVMIPQPMTK